MPLNIDIQQILIHMLNFAILFFALYFILYKPVKKFMDKRIEYYKDLDEQAKGKIEEAEKVKKDYEEKYASMSEDIEKDREALLAETKAACDVKLKEADTRSEEILEKSRKKAEAERERILGTISENAWDLITKAGKGVFLNNTSDAYDSFLESAKEQDKCVK